MGNRDGHYIEKELKREIKKLERKILSTVQHICYVETAVDYTLSSSDIGKTINADTTVGDIDIIFTAVDTKIGFWVVVRNVGTGVVTLLGATEVTGTDLATQYTAATAHIPSSGVVAAEGALT